MDTFRGFFSKKGKSNNGNNSNNNNNNTKYYKITTILDNNIEKIINSCEKGTIATLDTCKLHNDNLKRFALIQTILEIYDADHDLNRSKYDKNPLVEYCKSFKNFPKLVFINNKIYNS